VKILEDDFPRHVTAYQKFRQYLSKEKRVEFDTAWSEYSQHKAEDGKIYVHLGKYFNPAAYASHVKERDEAIKNIINILSFAEINHKSPFESNLP
jgi:RNA binding exosome subunit